MGTNEQFQQRENQVVTGRWEEDKRKSPSRQEKEDKKETAAWETGKKRESGQRG